MHQESFTTRLQATPCRWNLVCPESTRGLDGRAFAAAPSVGGKCNWHGGAASQKNRSPTSGLGDQSFYQKIVQLTISVESLFVVSIVETLGLNINSKMNITNKLMKANEMKLIY